MIRFIVSGIAVALIAFVINLMFYLGVFKDVQLTQSDEPALTLLYKEHLGPYHKIVPVIEEVEKWARSQNIDCTRSFGEYLDDPDKVEEDRRKSNGGCVVTALPSDLPADFKTKQIPAKKYLKATFEGSPSIGPQKVYSKVKKYAAEQRLQLQEAVIEIYVIEPDNKMTTTYLFAIE